jgi:CheY-like chemotaxis protein
LNPNHTTHLIFKKVASIAKEIMNTTPNGELIRILIVDDDAEDIQFFADALAKLKTPYALSSVKNIDQMFDWLNREAHPHLIFLDINLPLINGLEALRRLKAHVIFSLMPVIMFSNSSSELDIDRAYLLGAHYYMIKPYSLMNLKLSLEKVLSHDWSKRQLIPLRDQFLINQAFVVGEENKGLSDEKVPHN